MKKTQKLFTTAYIVPLFLAVSFLLIVSIGLIGCSAGPIGSVNDLPVYAEELALYKESLRASVAGYYAQTYAIDSMGDDFWDTLYGDSTPGETLTQQATEALVRDKVIQKMAMERSITAPGDFKKMKKALEQRNAAPDDAMDFGPEEYSPAEYLSYQMSRTEDDLKEYIDKTNTPTEQELKDAFDSLPDTLKEKHFTATGYSFTSSTKNSQELLDYLVQEKSASDHWQKNLPTTIEAIPYIFESENIHREDITNLHLAELLYRTNPDDFILFGEAVYWMETMEGGGLLRYEEAPGLGKNKWINDFFDQWVAQEIATAEVSIKN